MGVTSRVGRGMTRLKDTQRRKSDERFAERFAHQWTQLRADRRHEEPPRIEAGESNFSRAQVPYGIDLAAAWAWRFLVIAGAAYVVGILIATFTVLVLPLVIALFFAALAVPAVDLMHRLHCPRGVASLLVVIGGIGLVALLLTVAGQQIANGANDLAEQVVDGIEQIRTWLKDGPLHASDSQINGYLKQAQDLVTSGNSQVVTRVTEVSTAVSHIVAGIFIVLFATYFFLADGERIWAWLVRIFPRAARARVDSSGRVAWTSLTRFVRATVLVAVTDAIGIMIVAAILKVPFVFAIGVLVFLGAFIPMIGAALSGSVAVLVALVAHGPIVALIMLGGVVAVQQLEAHVLQPFLLGRFVSVHPLGVIVAIAAGVLVAGIPGALVAVPLVAALNAVVLHLSGSIRAERDASGQDAAAVATDVEPSAEPSAEPSTGPAGAGG
jgi:putative heme transporter